MTLDTVPLRTTSTDTSTDTPTDTPADTSTGTSADDSPPPAGRDTGPAARLVALPQLDAGAPTLAAVDDHLAALERARQAQLDALPPTPDHVVAAAHRRIVARLVEQVRDARARIRAGTYGSCARCGVPIPPRVLHREPWQTACAVCDPGIR